MFENLYKITECSSEGGNFSFSISLDAAHPIYQVHFPGTPITPGACQLEIFRQLASSAQGRDLSVAEVRNIKYLNIIDPLVNGRLSLTESFGEPDGDGRIKCNVVLSKDGAVFTKAVIIFA